MSYTNVQTRKHNSSANTRLDDLVVRLPQCNLGSLQDAYIHVNTCTYAYMPACILN